MNAQLRNKRLIVALLATIAFQSFSQGTFQNLNFEAAQLVPVPGGQNGEMQFAAAFPGWIGYIGGQMQTTTIQNNPPIGPILPFISIIGPPGANPPGGDYEVGFGAGWDGSNVISVALAQTGLVPSDAMSLQFLAPYASTISVFMGGQQLTTVPLNDNIFERRLFAVDISPFAGQSLELRFQPGPNINYLDDIQFSQTGVPEPSTLGMFGFGALLLGKRLWRKVGM